MPQDRGESIIILHLMSTLFFREIHNIGGRTREGLVTPEMAPALNAYGFRLVGWSEAREGFAFTRRSPDFSQILVVVSGIGEAWTEEGWQRIGPGGAYLTPPHVPHSYRFLGTETWSFVWAMHTTASLRERPFISGNSPVRTAVNPQPLSAAIRGLYSEAMNEAVTAVTDDWARLVSLYSRRIARPGDTGDPRLRRLWESVANDPSYDWNIQELAARADLSGEHLRRLCQRETNRSPIQQVTHLRMRHAAALLLRDAYPISDIASRIGYENPFAFTAAFKRFHGLSPAAFRKKGSQA